MPGTGTSNTVQVALYGEYAQARSISTRWRATRHADNRMNRPIVIPGLPSAHGPGLHHGQHVLRPARDRLQGSIWAAALGGFVTPFARLQASTSTQSGFSETGADSLDLTVAQQTTSSLRTVLGAQLGAGIDAAWREKLDLTFRLGWSHEYADTARPVTASFAGAPALSFTTFGAGAARWRGAGLGANTAIAEATVYLRYDGTISGQDSAHAITAGVRMTW